MARTQNKHTNFVRASISGWLLRNKGQRFTVPGLVLELKGLFEGLHIDASKMISNELIRREAIGLLVCERTEVVGVGRPPKVYRQKWVS